jgi:hypothetical protein
MDGMPRDNAISGYAGRAAMLATCLTLIAGNSSAQASAKSATAVEPGAVDALRRMGAYLRTLQHFSVSGETMRDELLRDGQKIEVGGTIRYVVRAPDRFRAEVRTDRKQRQIFYDGKSLTVYAPRMHYYASAPAPSTISATLDSARKRFNIELPLADLFLWGTPRDGVDELTAAQYIGPAFVDGTDTDQYAFRQRGVDWQLWIARGNVPLPRKLAITTTSEPSAPRFAATLMWDLTPPVGDPVFAFVPPKDAARIVFASVGATETKKPVRQ